MFSIRVCLVFEGESFSFLSCDFRRVQNRSRTGYFILMTPKQKARHPRRGRKRGREIGPRHRERSQCLTKKEPICRGMWDKPYGIVNIAERS